MKLNYVSTTLVVFHGSILFFEESYNESSDREERKLVLRLSEEQAESMQGSAFGLLLEHEEEQFNDCFEDWLIRDIQHPETTVLEIFALLNQWQAKRE